MNWEFIKGKTLEFTSDEVTTAVFKATNQIVCKPKEKHVRKLIELSHMRGAQVQMVEQFSKRLKSSSAVVVLKTLIVFIRVIRQGSDNFTDTLKRMHSPLLDFDDERMLEIYAEHGTFIKSFARYVQENSFADNSFIKKDLINSRDRNVDTGFKYAQYEDMKGMLNRYVELLQFLLDCSRHYIPKNKVTTEALNVLLKDAGGLYRLLSEGIIRCMDDLFKIDLSSVEEFLGMYRVYIDVSRGLKHFSDYLKEEWQGKNTLVINIEVPEKFLSTIESHVETLRGQDQDHGSGLHNLAELIGGEGGELVEDDIIETHDVAELGLSTQDNLWGAGNNTDEFDDFFASRDEKNGSGSTTPAPKEVKQASEFDEFDFFANPIPSQKPVANVVPAISVAVEKKEENLLEGDLLWGGAGNTVGHEVPTTSAYTGANTHVDAVKKVPVVRQGYVAEERDDFESLFEDMRKKDWGEDIFS